MRTPKRAAMIGLCFAGGLLAGGLPGGAPYIARDRAIDAWTTSVVSAAHARDVKFANAKSAYEQGLSAYRSGYLELAIPALEYVVARNDATYLLNAEFYLARIYADSAGPHTDHAKAYMLYQRISDEHADIDPDDAKRVPIVAKSLTALAIYVRDGLNEIGLKPDSERAIEYLRHAATWFNEPDAQFELAKINIANDRDRPNGLHFLQKLSRENHAGAQALLADLMARGKYVAKEPAQALALSRMAVERAGQSERVWIEHIYQSIYCGASPDVRERSTGFVANWKKNFAQPRADIEQPADLKGASGAMARVCANGERIDIVDRTAEASKPSPPAEALRLGAGSVGAAAPTGSALLPSGVLSVGPMAPAGGSGRQR